MKESVGFTVLLFTTNAAVADLIWEQPAPTTPGPAFVSQVFPDLPRYSTYQFDDFSLSQDMFIDRLTARGRDVGNGARQGNPDYNNGVIAEIWDNLPGSVYEGNKVLESVSGAEDLGTGTLTFDFGSQPLSTGHYWITVQIVRPYNPGGQWLWQSTPHVQGSEHFSYNPGGGYGMGNQPVSASKTTASRGRGKSDLVFTLEGHPQSSEYEPLPVPQF
jgi:hypothetical protein